MEFFRQEYWGGLLFSSPDLPDPGIEPGSLALQADSLSSEPSGKPISKKYFKKRVSNWSQKRVGRDLGTKATTTEL